MHINTLSAQLDQKLVELDRRLDDLNQQLTHVGSDGERHQLNADLNALKLTKDKLLKSRDIAWRAYHLQQQGQETQKIQRRRWIGLTLCIVSAVGLMIIAGVFWWTELR